MSSASKGRWRRISSGSVSAAITTNSEMPLLSVFVAEQNQNQPKIIQKNRKKRNLDGDSDQTFISTLLELLIVCCLLDEIHDRVRQVSISQRVRLWIHNLGTLHQNQNKDQSQDKSEYRDEIQEKRISKYHLDSRIQGSEFVC